MQIVFKEKELEKNATIQKFLIVQKEGNREVSRNVEHYNLDMILSVGYRVNSNKLYHPKTPRQLFLKSNSHHCLLPYATLSLDLV